MGHTGAVIILWTILVFINSDVNGAAISHNLHTKISGSAENILKFAEEPAVRKCGYEVIKFLVFFLICHNYF